MLVPVGEGSSGAEGTSPPPTPQPGFLDCQGSIILQNAPQNTLGVPSPSLNRPLPFTLHEVQHSPSPNAQPQSPRAAPIALAVP